MGKFSKSFPVVVNGECPNLQAITSKVESFIESGFLTGDIEIRVVGEAEGLERVRERSVAKAPRKPRAKPEAAVSG